MSRDAQNGDYIKPLSLNGWGYVEGNPINLIDPTGYCSTTPQVNSTKCKVFVAQVDRFIALAQANLKTDLPIALPGDIDSYTVMMLAHYYSGFTFGLPPFNIPNLFAPAPEYFGAPEKAYGLDKYDISYGKWSRQESEEEALKYGFKRIMYSNTHHYFAVFYAAWFRTSLGGAALNEMWELLANGQLGGKRDVADIATARLAINHMRQTQGWFFNNDLNLLPSLLERDVCADSIEAIYAGWDELQRFR